jgi:hypothetical protein
MSPALLLFLLLAGLLALLPVWRLRVAGWPWRALVTAWIVYGLSTLVVMRFPISARFLAPILVLAFVAPFVAGPERLSRVLRGRQRPRPVIDVTPNPPPGLDEPPVSGPPTDATAGNPGPDPVDDGVETDTPVGHDP